MKLLVLGAAGKTGKEVVRQAVQQDHTVSVLVHNNETYEDPTGDTLVFSGDAADPAVLDRALAGQQAVLDCIGGHTPFRDTDLERNTAAAVIAAMPRHGVRRLVVVSMLGEGDSIENAPWAYRHLLYPTYLRGADQDKAAMESEVSASDLDWVILRPAVLTDEPATGLVEIFSSADPGKKAHTITRADLAAVMLAHISGTEHLREAVTLANNT